MSSKNDPFSMLDDILLDTEDTITSEELAIEQDIPLTERVEVEGIDPRLKLISHSSRTTLHKCPRKFQLYRLNSKDDSPDKSMQSVTFAYGHAVGVGIQSTLEGKNTDKVLLETALAWDTSYDLENPKQKKSIWEAIFAVQRFIAIREQGYLEEYELVYYQGKPAVELSFIIQLPNGFTYRGYVDAVLKHKTTGEVMVVECKTSSGQPNSAQYKNSGQGLGYSIVLDILFPNLSSYTVLYLVYYTRGREYIELPFEKSLLQKALWLQELLIDTKHIELYEEFETYPMHGESCFDFFHPCEYLGLCTLNTANLTKPLTQKDLDKIEEDRESFMFSVDFYDLIEAQIKKGEGEI